MQDEANRKVRSDREHAWQLRDSIDTFRSSSDALPGEFLAASRSLHDTSSSLEDAVGVTRDSSGEASESAEERARRSAASRPPSGR